MIAHLWQALWPNVVAPSMWTLAGIGAHHVASRRASRKEHEKTRAHVTRAASPDTEGEAL